jgi:hypothetical protein
MPLSTYAELQAHIASDLIRTDLTTPIQDCIRLAEAHMSNTLKTREMDVTATLTITTGEADIPTTLQSVRSMRDLTSPFGEIVYEGIETLEVRRPDAPGPIKTYSMVGEKFVFWPPISGSARLRYRRDVPVLSDSNTSNWILAEHPHAYLYGALYQTHMFLKDEARARGYGQLFAAAIEEINARDAVSQLSGLTARANTQVV